MKLPNYVKGQWSEGTSPGEALTDPGTGQELARISSQGINLAEALAFARTYGGPALRRLSYAQRAEILGKMADALVANRDEYFRISLLNLGANQADASFDVDGAIYTIKYYAKIGRALADGKMLKEGAAVSLSKSNAFAGQHLLMPAKGAAVFINAFNFPAWGLCEKAAPALLSGVPIVVKPASPTAWLTHRMVEDIVKADILPPGAISIICGSARDLLGHVREEDIVSFTGSADTAARIRSDDNILRRSVRVNIEADSINSAILGPDCAPDTDLFDLLGKEVVREMTLKADLFDLLGKEVVREMTLKADLFDLLGKEVVREMTLKAGQKCTTIRRIMVPRQHLKAFGDAVAARLASMKVGNPRNSEAKVGPVVNKRQQSSCFEGLDKLKEECEVLFGGDKDFQPLDADPQKSAFVQPALLSCKNGLDAKYVHDLEVFGPVATLVPYEGLGDLIAITRRGLGSLVASVFSDDASFTRETILGI